MSKREARHQRENTSRKVIINGHTTRWHLKYGVLAGEIELHTLEGGPLWIVQDSDNIRVRYLIHPAK